MRSRLFLAAIFVLFFSGCSHSLHQVYQSDIASAVKSGKKITAQSEQFVVLGFAFDTLYVNRGKEQFMEQCAGRPVEGVTTEFWTSHGFFSWTNKVRFQGYCL